MGCRATRESAQWGPDGPRTGCRCSGSTPITHTEAVEPSADPSRWRCGRAGFQTGGVENQILGLAVWKLQKSVGGVEAAFGGAEILIRRGIPYVVVCELGNKPSTDLGV